jgi:hypothetical protein
LTSFLKHSQARRSAQLKISNLSSSDAFDQNEVSKTEKNPKQFFLEASHRESSRSRQFSNHRLVTVMTPDELEGEKGGCSTNDTNFENKRLISTSSLNRVAMDNEDVSLVNDSKVFNSVLPAPLGQGKVSTSPTNAITPRGGNSKV